MLSWKWFICFPKSLKSYCLKLFIHWFSFSRISARISATFKSLNSFANNQRYWTKSLSPKIESFVSYIMNTELGSRIWFEHTHMISGKSKSFTSASTSPPAPSRMFTIRITCVALSVSVGIILNVESSIMKWQFSSYILLMKTKGLISGQVNRITNLQFSVKQQRKCRN